jgi:drug/metabolite transporter (DMT)-like permease
VTAIVPAIAARPRLAALLGAVCISFTGVLYRLSGVTPETATVFRCLYGLPLLLLALYLERRSVGPMTWHARRLAAFAGLLFAGDLLFWHHAIDAVGAGLATVLGNMQVVIVAIAAWLIWGERPSRRTLTALPIVLSGVVLIAGILGGNTFGVDPALGVVLGIFAAFTYAGYLIVIRQAGRGRVSEPVVISTTTTLLVGVLVGAGLGRLDPLPSVQANVWLAILGVSAQAAGYLLISISLPRLPAVVTSIILLCQPVLSVLLGMIVLGESPSVGQMLGVALVIGGIAFATVPIHALRRRVLPASP